MADDDPLADTAVDVASAGEQREIEGLVMQRLFGKAAPEREPQRFGRYRVQRLLGRGAMGAVYAAHDPDLDRDVALKVLHAEIAANERASLVAEAKAMARLNDRNVVAVYDVGEQDDRVFVAMEQVDGHTLRQWREEPRSWAEVTAAYLQAARGLAAAHGAGVVHRDFKPDNVLIDADGRVAVADFGLARVGEQPRARVEQSLSPVDAASFTDSEAAAATQSLAGTPAYLAPETIRGNGAGRRSDQFAFAVSLWESLYGQRPFEGKTIESLLVRICDGEREPPPTDVVVPARLVAAVERGLATDPEARFPSVDAMADALERCLVPWHRRLRGPAALVAIGAGVVFGGWGYGELQISRCEDEAGAVATVWSSEARSEVRAALQANEVAYAGEAADRVEAHLDGWAERWRDGRRDACTSRADDGWATRRSDCYDRRLSELRGLLGVLVRADAELAEHAIVAATGLAEPQDCRDDDYLAATGVLPTSEGDVQRVEAVRETLSRARTLTVAAKYDEALSLVQAQLPEVEALEVPALEAHARLSVGTILGDRGDFDEARPELERSYTLATQTDESTIAALAALELARNGSRSGREREARVWATAAEGHLDRLGTTAASNKVWRFRVLSNIEESLGNLDDALDYVEQARALAEESLEPNDAGYIRVLSLEARLRGQRREFSRSIPMLRDVIARIGALKGEHHPSVIPPMQVLAQALTRTGQLDEALEVGTRARELSEETHGPEHPETSKSIQNLGVVRMVRGELGEAAALFERALELRRKRFGPTHRATLGPLTNLALIEMDRGNFEVALRYGDERVDGLRASDQPDPKGLAHALLNRAATKERLGRYDDAVADLDDALATLKPTPGEGGQMRGFVLHGRAVAKGAAGRIDEALADSRAAFVVLDPSLEVSDSTFREVLATLGDLLERAGERDEAATVLQRAADAFAEHAPDDPLAGKTLFALARLEGQAGSERAKQARKLVPDEVKADVDAWLREHGG